METVINQLTPSMKTSLEFYGEKEFPEDDFLYHTFRNRIICSLAYNK